MLSCALLAPDSQGAVWTPSVFGDHMVLQREQNNPVWGWANPGERVIVRIGDQRHQTEAGPDGAWRVSLEPLQVGGPYELGIRGEENSLTYEDVLVGEVWVCSGQSNMEWPVDASNDPDIEKLTAKYSNIRLITVPKVGTQKAQRDFVGQWQACSPETIGGFSAVGYYFGRQLHQTLDVPIGLIDNAWGGSAAEAWVRRDILSDNPDYAPLMDRWAKQEIPGDAMDAMNAYEEALWNWNKANEVAKIAGEPQPASPRRPGGALAGNQRPGNLFNGNLHPVIGYGIRGAIWYQGESNASRAYQYRDLFPTMIASWRDLWGQGDFSFYWVQLADFRDEKPDPGESDWAELREAQTMTMRRLPNTGEAVIIDLGEAHDIHPKDKQGVAQRLARWALAQDYGFELAHHSPTYASMEVDGAKAVLKFEHVGGGLDTFDVRQPVGFAIAGEDRKFHWAEGKIVDGNTMEIWAEGVEAPVAVRYAWADNPVCNMQSREGLPMTPFRTDDWPGVTLENR